MQCPRCGWQIADPNAVYCPNCAQLLVSTPPPSAPLPYGDVPPGSSGAPYPGTNPAAEYPPTSSPYGTTNPGYTMPAGTPYPPPSYPTPYPPQGQFVPYVQEPPKKRNNVGLIVGLSVGIPLVLLVACVAGAVLLMRSQSSTTQIVTPSGKTITLTYKQLYKNSLTTNTIGWANDAHCFFEAGGYHVIDGYFCFAPIPSVGNGIVNVDVKQISGPITHFYGIGFRRVSKGNHYFFGIDGNGTWLFAKDVNGQGSAIIPYGPSPAIHRGLDATNTLKVVMQGDQFTFFINGTQVGSATDATFATGRCGVEGSTQVEVVFNNIEVDTINS